MNAVTIVRNALPMKIHWPDWLLKDCIKRRYRQVMGVKLDLNNLNTFNEKIQWMKLCYRNPEVCSITDKHKFKSYVINRLGTSKYTVPELGFWYNWSDFEKDFSNLPNEFVLKGNLSFGGHCIHFVHDKDNEDMDALRRLVENWINPRNTMLNNLGCHLYDSTPCILAEPILSQDNHIPYDYKFYCFDGKPYCAYTSVDHFSENGSAITFYDTEWSVLDVTYDNKAKSPLPKPENLEEMLAVASQLSTGFPFVRVDFFNLGSEIYLSELTFDSGDGMRKFDPESFDLELGKQFNIQIDR